MKMSADDELTDGELSEMLGAWTVPDPPQRLRARIFSKLEGEFMNIGNPAFSLPLTLEVPWYQSLFSQLKDLLRPERREPLQITSRPLEPTSIWGAYAGCESRSGVLSVLLHVGVVAVLLLAFQTPQAVRKMRDSKLVYLAAYQPKLPAAAHKSGGGGGGGQKASNPVSHGVAPKFAPKQFMPPIFAMARPVFPVTPTITAEAPPIVADQYGDPLSKLLASSGGPGSHGLGAGTGGGLGNGRGDGFGPGSGGGLGGGIYRIGGDVSAPVLISKIEPEYSEQARKAKYSGTVLLSVVVDQVGIPRDIKVVRPLGLGLDEKAIEAVARWRFRPAVRNGRPVAVTANVEVNFRLL